MRSESQDVTFQSLRRQRSEQPVAGKGVVVTSKVKGCVLGCGGIAVVGTSGFVGLLYLVQTLSNAIFPGNAGIVRSFSTAPYDIYLRTNIDMRDNERSPPVEWHLRVPRTAIYSEDGSNGTLGDYHKNPSPVYIVNITARYNDDRTAIDLRRSTDVVQPNKDFYIDVESMISGRLLYGDKPDTCKTEQEALPITLPRCDTPFCGLYTSVQGWYVKVLAPAMIFHSDRAAIQSTCDQVRAFLSKYTINVDDIR